MTDIEFIIPTNKDELLQGDGEHYTVSYVCAVEDIPERLTACRMAVSEIGSDFILEHFDTLFAVLVHFKHLEWSVISKAWDVVMRGYSMLTSNLAMVLEEELDNELRAKMLNIVRMQTYILAQLMKCCEEKINQKPEDGILMDSGRGRKKATKKLADEDFNWTERNHNAFVQMYKTLQLPINKLWDPPVVEEEFVNLMADACYKALEDPSLSAAKMKYMRETIFQVVGTLVKRYNHGLSCSIKIIHMLKLHEHLVSTMAQGVVQLVREFDCRTIVRELVREISEVVNSDLVQDTSGTKAFSQFLVEIAENVPDLIVTAINLMVHHLDGESHSMRICVLGIMGEIVLKLLSLEDLDSNSREMRDQFLDHLEEHMHDTHTFVRVKVLQIWQRLCREKAIPLSRLTKVLKKVLGRLHDKSSNVKKNAVQLVTTFLEKNPFATKRLTVESLKSQLEKEMKTLETLKEKAAKLNGLQSFPVVAGRQQAWQERQAELSQVIEQILKTGNSEDEPATQVLTQNSLAEALEEIRMKLTQKEYVDAYYLLRNAEKQFPGAEALRNNMEMVEQVGYFLSLMQKIFMECNSSESSQQSSQTESEPNSQPTQEATQDTQTSEENSESVNSALEAQERMVQYIQDSITFAELVSSAIPMICQLLQSKQSSDVIEAIEFFTSAYEYGLTDAAVGVRKMLPLVWSREQATKDAVVAAYQRLYLSPNGANPRACGVSIVRSLSELLKSVDLGQQAALSELVKHWVQTGAIDKHCMQVMWERFSMALPDTSDEDSLAALVLLGMVSKSEVNTVNSNIPVLVSIGLGERAMKNYRLAKETCIVLQKLVPDKPKPNSPDPPLRFANDHDIFTNLIQILKTGFLNEDDNLYTPFAMEAIDLMYQLAEQPHILCQDLLYYLSSQVKQGKMNTASEAFDQLNSENTPSQRKEVSAEILSRFVFMIGHIALRQMIFLDVSVFCELKRRNFLREQRDEAKKGGNNKKGNKTRGSKTPVQTPNSSYVSTSASETPRMKQDHSDDELGAVGAVADDQEAEYIRNVCENEIVTGENFFACCRDMVVDLCANPNIYGNVALQASASLTLAKMMLVSSKFCEDHLQLLVTMLEKSVEPVTRSNLVIALGDLSYRFPNVVEPWTSHIYKRLRDQSPKVRQHTVMVLTHLIMNDMIKVKGQISELALCIVDEEQRISEMTQVFFTELSMKGNALYNVMPDIISRLSASEANVDEAHFHTIFRFLMGLIQKDRQLESLVEKLCLRFRVSQTERQFRDLAFCLSLLTYSDRSLRRLQENFVCYADKLHAEEVYNHFCTIINAASKSSKADVKAIAEELGARIKECHEKSADDMLTANKAAGVRRSTHHTPAANRVNPNGGRLMKTMPHSHTRRRRQVSDSEDSDGEKSNSDKENCSNKSQAPARSSARLQSVNKGRPPQQVESDDDSDDVFERPRNPTRKTNESKKPQDKEAASIAKTPCQDSPVRKRLRSSASSSRKGTPASSARKGTPASSARKGTPASSSRRGAPASTPRPKLRSERSK